MARVNASLMKSGRKELMKKKTWASGEEWER